MKPIYLLDTDIVFEMMKRSANETLLERIANNKDFCVISAFTWYECLSAVNEIENEALQNKFNSFLIDSVQKYFEIIPFDVHAASIQADIENKLKNNPKAKKIKQIVLQNAALAIANNLILVSTNESLFEEIKSISLLNIENWA